MLWPDERARLAVRRVWDELADRGLPSLATYTHRLHQPHVSLTVGEHLPADEALGLVGALPERPVRLRVEAAGVFPGGALFFACVVHQGFLDEQRRVHGSVEALVADPWPYFRPGCWTPHITCAMDCRPEQMSEALSVLLDHLPIEGSLDHGGVEDGTTGENWPSHGGHRGLRRAAMLLIVTDDGRLLLHHRDDKAGIAHPDCWAGFGGAVEDGESVEAALCREVHEETGVVVREPRLLGEAVDVEGDGRLVSLYYVVGGIDPGDITLSEGAGVGVHSFSDLGRLKVTPFVRRAIERQLRPLVGRLGRDA